MKNLRHNSLLPEVAAPDELELRKTAPLESVHVADSIRYVELFWRERRFLGRMLLYFFAGTLVISLLIPTRYESTVTIMPPENLQGSLGATLLGAVAGKTADSSLASLAGGLLGLKTSGALFAKLLHSRTVQDRLIDRYNLQAVYWVRYKQDARKKLDHLTSVSEDHKSGIISISVTDSSPARARDLAQSYVDELNNLLARVSTSSAKRERKFIEQRLVSVKEDLSDAENQFSLFASQNTALDIKEQTKAMVESAAVLQGQLIAAQSELQSLEQIYTSNNVRVRALQARVAELKRQLQNLGGAGVAPDDVAPSDDIYPSIRRLPLLGVKWADLYRRLKIQETVFELLNQQYEMARIQEAKEIPTVNVVDPANYPEKKSFPPRLIIIFFGTVVLFAGALGWVVNSDRWSHLQPEDPRKVLAFRISDEVATHWPSLAAKFDRSRQLNGSDGQHQE